MYLVPAPTNDPSYPFILSHSWLFGISGQLIGQILAGLVIVAFLLAGFAVLGVPGLADLWKVLVLIAAGLSLLLMILFWHPWLSVGALINIAIIIVFGFVGWNVR